MRRAGAGVGVVFVVALLASLVSIPQASAAACNSTVLSGVALIVGTSGADDLWIKTDGTDVLCRNANSGAYTAVGTKAAIGTVDVNVGSGDDNVHIGDSTNPAGAFTFEGLDIDFGGGTNDILTVDDSALGTDVHSDIFDSFISGIAFDGIYPSHATRVDILTGAGSDSFNVHLPTFFDMTIGGGGAANSVLMLGSAASETYELTREVTTDRVTYNTTRPYDFLSSIGTVEISSGDGADTIRATEPWLVAALQVNGGDGNDRIVGNVNADVLAGDGGNDRISGGAGADQIDGGPGRRDTCRGGPGKDKFKRCERVTA